MTARRALAALLAPLFWAAPTLAEETALSRALAQEGWTEAVGAKIENEKDGRAAFRTFAAEARRALGGRDKAADAWLAALADGDSDADAPEGAWSVLLPRYAVARHGKRLVWATQSLVSLRTVNAPDGPPPSKNPAFRDMERRLAGVAKELGLDWTNHDGLAWTAATGARPNPATAVVHADVVPEGDGKWSHPPFKAALAEDAIWGRGALDDKGPLAAHLFAMAALRDSGVATSRDAELLIGLDEETDWDGFRAYLAKRGAPKIAYVADAWFPVVVGEKGVLNLGVRGARRAPPAGSPAPVFRLEELRAGAAPNVVPAEAEARVRVAAATLSLGQLAAALDGYIIKFKRAYPGVGISYTWKDGDLRLSAHGAAAHGARPWEGKNAATHLLVFCAEYLKMDAYSMGDVAYWAATRLGVDYDGRELGVRMRHPAMGETTASLGVIAAPSQGAAQAVVNLRWPVGKTAKEMADALRANIAAYNKETGASLAAATSYEFDPFLLEEDTPVVRALLEVYRDHTDGFEGGITIEGTTYAKAIPGAVSFGPNFDGSGLKIHAENERIPLSHLRTLLEMYTDALYRLTR